MEQQLFETPYRSPQLAFWDREEVEWLSVIRVPPYARRRRHDVPEGQQLRLFPEDEPAVVAG